MVKTKLQSTNKEIIMNTLKTTMTKKEILEGSELIASFMGATFDPNWRFLNDKKHPKQPTWIYAMDNRPTEHSSIHWGVEGMEYHSRWDWLMPVVEKIRTIQLPLPSMIPVGVTIDNYGCRITDGCWNGSVIVSNTTTENPDVKELTYKTIVKFIKWYNHQNKK